MYNRYSDFEELRPTGEASHIPDTKLDDGCEGDPRRQRVATTTGGSPDAPTATDGECRSCGASIPASQTKCRFCLTDHLGDKAASTGGMMDATLRGIVHLVVESTTFYGALAKGSAAASLLISNETEPAVDDYTRLYNLGETLRPSWQTDGLHSPPRYKLRQQRESSSSQPPAIERGGAGMETRSTSKKPRRTSTTNVGTASATSRASGRFSTTPAMTHG